MDILLGFIVIIVFIIAFIGACVICLNAIIKKPLPPKQNTLEGANFIKSGPPSGSTKILKSNDGIEEADLKIKYLDSRGDISERCINVIKIVEGWKELGQELEIKAYCYLRKGNRTFKADRIKELTDLHTGEKVQNIPEYLLTTFKPKKRKA